MILLSVGCDIHAPCLGLSAVSLVSFGVMWPGEKVGTRDQRKVPTNSHDNHITSTEKTNVIITLSPVDHFRSTCKKANSSVGFLRRNLPISQEHKANASKTLIRPQVEYAAAAWDPYTKENKDKLEMVQRREACYVCINYIRESSVMAMINQLGWCSLQQCRADIRLVLFYNGLVALDFLQE